MTSDSTKIKNKKYKIMINQILKIGFYEKKNLKKTSGP